MHPKLIVSGKRTAQTTGLLSLPDELLVKIAHETYSRHEKSWAVAAATCKRLWELQLSSAPVVETCQRLEWHLKHFQHAKRLAFRITKWPSDEKGRRELSESITESSCKLRMMKQLEIVPLCFIALSSQQWIPGMLSGATSLIDIRLGVELLPSLPASRREALEHLHVDAYFGRGRAGLDILQAIKECVNLRSLTITCLDKGLYIDELDLRHLAHLDTCRLQCLPAPARLSLSRGRVELTMTSEQVEAWSQLWPQIQPHVHFVKLEGYQHFTRSAFHSAGGLHACDWPLGIDNFHGLQFLQINCDSVRASGEAEGDLLGHLSYIPHVLLRCQESVGANLSTGSWKVLEIHSAMVFDVTIADVETFMKSIGIFRFTFPANSNKQAAELLRQLRKAGAKTGMPLYESSSTFSPVLECPSNEVVVELSNHRRELQDDPCSPFLEALRRHA